VIADLPDPPRPRVVIASAAIATLIGTLLFPFEFIGPDQGEFLPLIRHALDPAHLRTDWFVNSHAGLSVREAYVWLLAALSRACDSAVVAHRVVWYVTAITSTVAAAGFAAAFGAGRWTTLAFATTVAVVYASVFSFATTTFADPTPAPSFVAQALSLGSWALLLWGYPISAVIVGMAASLLHLQVGPIALMLGGVAVAFRDRRLGFAAVLPAIAGVMILLSGFVLFGIDSREVSRQSTYLMVYVRMPWHYVPWDFPITQYVYLAMSLIALVWIAWNRGGPVGRFITGLLAGLTLLAVAGILALTVPGLQTLSKLSPFRVWVLTAPIAGAAMAAMLMSLHERFRPRWVVSANAVLYLIVMASAAKMRFLGLATVLIAIASTPLPRALLRSDIVTTVAVVLLTATLSVGSWRTAREWIDEPGDRSAETQRLYAPRAALAACLRESTDADAVFLVPPDQVEWRIDMERAIFVDVKAFPFKGHDILEWYRRMNLILQQPVPAPFAAGEITSAYRKLTAVQVTDLAKSEGLDYFVTDKDYPAFATACAVGEWRAYTLPRS
jgi:hypothetical protein